MSIKKSKIKKVYELLKAREPEDLFDKYLIEDQKIVTSKTVDYLSKNLVINKVRKILEDVDARRLTRKEQSERRHILWLWYHHAISYAVWGYKDKKMALRYSALALKYQPKKHGNKITKLLYYLVRNKTKEAKEWSKKIQRDEQGAAKEVLSIYENNGFFK